MILAVDSAIVASIVGVVGTLLATVVYNKSTTFFADRRHKREQADADAVRDEAERENRLHDLERDRDSVRTVLEGEAETKLNPHPREGMIEKMDHLSQTVDRVVERLAALEKADR